MLWTSMHSFMREAMLKDVGLALHEFPQNTTSMVLVFCGESNYPKILITDIWGVHSCSSQGIPGVKLELRSLFPQSGGFSIFDLIVLYCSLGQEHHTENRVFLVLPRQTVDFSSFTVLAEERTDYFFLVLTCPCGWVGNCVAWTGQSFLSLQSPKQSSGRFCSERTWLFAWQILPCSLL